MVDDAFEPPAVEVLVEVLLVVVAVPVEEVVELDAVEVEELVVLELDAVVDDEDAVVEVLVAVEELMVELDVVAVVDFVVVELAVLELEVVVAVAVPDDAPPVDVAFVVVDEDEEEVEVAVAEVVDELLLPPCLGSTFTVHFETFSKTSSPLAFFFGVRMISQVSVRIPAVVSVVVLVVTDVDPFEETWRARRGRALTWAENRKKKERMTRNKVWVGRIVCIENIVQRYLTNPVLPKERPSVQGIMKDRKRPQAKELRKRR